MKLICNACDKEIETQDIKTAWLEGWDIIVVAGCQIVTCDKCPSSPEIFKKNENIDHRGSP